MLVFMNMKGSMTLFTSLNVYLISASYQALYQGLGVQQ